MNTTPLRYVVLRHEGIPSPHFDLMFETSPGSALATWRSDSWPPRGNEPLTRLPDHRSHYLSYEGPVSGDRGHVTRVAAGHHHSPRFMAGQFETTLDDGTEIRIVQA